MTLCVGKLLLSMKTWKIATPGSGPIDVDTEEHDVLPIMDSIVWATLNWKVWLKCNRFVGRQIDDMFLGFFLPMQHTRKNRRLMRKVENETTSPLRPRIQHKYFLLNSITLTIWPDWRQTSVLRKLIFAWRSVFRNHVNRLLRFFKIVFCFFSFAQSCK